jgi:hypothetical protein
MVETWPYFLELAAGALFAAGVGVVSYGAVDHVRQKKFVLAMWVYLATMVVAGGLAFGQTYWLRNDSVSTQWGRWALFTATNGAAVGVITASLTPDFIDTVLGVLLGSASALFLLFGALTPVQNGGNSRSAAIMWTTFSGAAALAAGLLLAGIALGWRRFILFPSAYKSTDGRANVINRWWYVLLTLGVWAVLSLYTVLYAVGPSGWRVYTSEFEQIWLTMALADGLLKFIIMPLAFFFLNPDGAASTETAFEVLQAAEPLLTQPAAAYIGSGLPAGLAV